MHDNSPQSVRESYDRLAEEYARRLFHELEHKAIDRELLSRFASNVRNAGDVCDLGCGPGHVARYLHEAGIRIFGLDLSPRMVELAQQLNPEIRFSEGDMMALDLPDESLSGIVAFYSIVNIPTESLPAIFAEMKRVLKPGGKLLLAFHIGEGVSAEEQLWGHRISMDFFFFQPAEIKRELETAGLA